MYFYQIGYHSYEDSAKHLVMNKKLYSDKEFKTLISILYIEELLKIETDINELTIENIDFTIIIERLVKEFGFIKPEITTRFSPFGWASIKEDSDWREIKDKDLNFIRDIYKGYIKKLKIQKIMKSL